MPYAIAPNIVGMAHTPRNKKKQHKLVYLLVCEHEMCVTGSLLGFRM